MLNSSWLIILLVILPLIIGSIWCDKKYSLDMYTIIDWYVCGYCTMTAVFQLICVPMCLLKAKFNILVIVYSVVIITLGCVAWVRLVLKVKKGYAVIKRWDIRLKKDEIFYILLIAGLLIWQIYYALFYGITVMSYDDATYLVYANSAIKDNHMYMTEITTGYAQNLDIQRSLQSSIIFISYLSKVTMINVPVMAHTIMVIQIIIMSYAAYALIARRLFDKRDSRLIFMIFMEVIYIFGFYSMYSVTFRLLGAPWQGKAIFAVVLTPYLFVVVPKALREKYSNKNGFFIMMLSLASSALSLAGAGTSIVIITLMVVLYIIVDKNFKNLLYILWGGFAPAVYCGIYLMMR